MDARTPVQEADVTNGRAPRRRRLFDPHSPTFASFADVLYAGALVFVSMIPLVTGFAGFSAAVQVFREARLSDGHVTIGAFGRALLDRVAKHWVSHIIIPTLVGVVLAAYLIVLPTTGLDPQLALIVPVVLASVAGAIGLRFAGTWRPGMRARAVFREAWRRMSDDPAGSLLLAGAAFTALVIVSFASMLVIVIAGPLVLAAVAIDARYVAARTDEDAR